MTSPRELSGTPVVPGVGYAPALTVRTDPPESAIAALREQALTRQEALQRYDDAVTAVADRLTRRAESLTGPAAEVLTATAVLTRDPGLRAAVDTRLESGADLLAGVSAAVGEFVAMFTELGDVMAERVTDLRDIERRLTAELVGAPEPGIPEHSDPVVLVAEDLAPADTVGLTADEVAALVTEHGGPTSHTAIIARQLGIPCVVAVTAVLPVPDGTPVLVDGGTGQVTIAPDDGTARRHVEAATRHRRAIAGWSGPGRTSDGHRVRLLANVHDASSAAEAARGAAEGVGLFRTELCFLDRAQEPSVEEQADVYAQVLEAFGPDRHVVVRTLDAGSDKPMRFATLPGEDNPALGVRGIRLSMNDPGLLQRQLEAIAQAGRATATSPAVMAPMIATVDEARGFAARVRALGLSAGVMIEVPSAALLAEPILEHVDFLSIGSNDLAQYTMAADRLSGELAHLNDPWQPAVLALIARVAAAGRAASKPVGVCGEAAADPDHAVVLAGMGVTSLSMAAPAVRAVGHRLTTVSTHTCEQAAAAALAAADPSAGRHAVRALLPDSA